MGPKISTTVVIVLFIVVLNAPVWINLDVFDEALSPDVAELLTYYADEPDTTDRLLRELAADAEAIPDLHERYAKCTARTQVGCLQIFRDDLAANPAKGDPELTDLLKIGRAHV